MLWAGPSHAETYDTWCEKHYTPGQIAAGLASPVRDSDGDGCANVIEYFGGCDPWDASSRLALARSPGAPGTIVFTMATDREDVVHVLSVSANLVAWSEDEAAQLCTGPEAQWSLNGHPFVRLGVKRRAGHLLDSDRDGLDDYFEESLAAADGPGGFTHLGEILPGDDFDGDGTANLDEADNAPEPLTDEDAAPAIDAALLNCALEAAAPPAPDELVVHTPLE